MAKKIKCTLYGYGRWGYAFTPIVCDSMAEAKRRAKENLEEGYWWSYRIVVMKGDR